MVRRGEERRRGEEVQRGDERARSWVVEESWRRRLSVSETSPKGWARDVRGMTHRGMTARPYWLI